MCLEFATFDWPNFRLWAGIRRRPNLNYLNELENDRAFGRLSNGFKKPFLAGEPLASERTTENLVSWKLGNAAALGRICSPRIRRIPNFPQRDFWPAMTSSLSVIRNRSVNDRASASQRARPCLWIATRSHSIIQSRSCASGYVNRHARDTFRRV